jgi:pre-mRNA-processing factor 17
MSLVEYSSSDGGDDDAIVHSSVVAPSAAPRDSRKRDLALYQGGPMTAEIQSFDPAIFKARQREHELRNVKARRIDPAAGKRDKGGAGLDYKGPWAKFKEDESASSSSSAYEEEYEEEDTALSEAAPLPPPPVAAEAAEAESSEFVGTSEFDYLGRTYMHVPPELRRDPGDQECFRPKRILRTFKGGHVGGVTQLRYFPRAGHLLLSSGNDATIKLWDAHGERKELLRIFRLRKPVKDVNFSPDGTRFLAACYDHFIREFDTETGKCLNKIDISGANANSVNYNPVEPYSILGALSNKKIQQFDLREEGGKVTQTYDHHLGPVNCIQFIDHGKRFISSSDDKSLRVWDWSINVPIKFIADPYQHSMPVLKLHPSEKYFVAQSMDNTIITFGATDKSKFRRSKNKVFDGHVNAGYPVGLDFSPDGKYLYSGDVNGNLCMWNWSGHDRNVTKLKGHKGVLLSLAVAPQATSRLVTGGLDGSIHLWD